MQRCMWHFFYVVLQIWKVLACCELKYLCFFSISPHHLVDTHLFYFNYICSFCAIKFALSIRSILHFGASINWNGPLSVNKSTLQIWNISSEYYMYFHTTPLCLPCYALPCLHCYCLASRLSSTQSITHALFPNLCWVIHWIKSILTLLTLYSWKMIIFFTFLCVLGFSSS